MRWVVILMMSTLLTSTVFAHSNILYDINLDFDPTLKSEITKVAQDHFAVNEKPIFFDYDRELLRVKFDRTLEYSVTVHPVTLAVHGFRDDSKATIKGTKSIAERKAAAESVFNSLPDVYKDQLRYGEEEVLYHGVFKHTWYRYVDGVFVANDHLEVEVNPNGEIVAWRLSPFFYKASRMKTTPAFSSRVAEQIALLEFNGEEIDFSPILIIYNTEPVWVVKIKTLYPIFVGVNSQHGKVLFTGGLRTELPEDYSVTKEPQINEYIREVQQ